MAGTEIIPEVATGSAWARAHRMITDWRLPSDLKNAAISSISGTADIVDMVTVFHRVYDLPIVKPWQARADLSHISPRRLAMRFNLIVEEMRELFEAMDIRCDMTFSYLDENDNWVQAADVLDAIENTAERNIGKLADACFDLKYVIVGFELEVGIDPKKCATVGQCSNLSKLMPDGTVLRREDGKVLKGPNFFEPDMRTALFGLGMRVGSDEFPTYR